MKTASVSASGAPRLKPFVCLSPHNRCCCGPSCVVARRFYSGASAGDAVAAEYCVAMGLVLLDVTFQTEKAFKIRMRNDWVQRLGIVTREDDATLEQFH